MRMAIRVGLKALERGLSESAEPAKPYKPKSAKKKKSSPRRAKPLGGISFEGVSNGCEI